MLENQMSRWGAISKALEDVSPQSKVFFVGDTDDTGYVDFVNEFPPDKDGVVRVYSSMFDSTMLANTRAAKGDVVLVMPGHNEAITSDQSITTNGLKFIALGEGNARATVTYNDTAASISLDTDNIEFKNFRLLASVSGITRAVDVNGSGCVVKDNSLQFDANGDDFIIGVRVNDTGNYSEITDNEFLGEDTVGPTNAVLVVGGADFVKTKNNHIVGQYSTAAINYDSTAASAGVDISDNDVFNSDTASTLVIKVGHASSKGIVARNTMASNDTATAAASQVEQGACAWFENYFTRQPGIISGTLIPTAST